MIFNKNKYIIKGLNTENNLLVLRIADLCEENKYLKKQIKSLENKYGDLKGLLYFNKITK